MPLAEKARKAGALCQVFQTTPARREEVLQELGKLYPQVDFGVTKQGDLALTVRHRAAYGGLPKSLLFNVALALCPSEEDPTRLVALKNRYGPPGEIFVRRAMVTEPARETKTVWEWLRSPAL